jgi:Cdc6-like AAA superfamily ATPase
MDEKKIKELNEEVQFRSEQLQILYNLLIKNQTILFPAMHLFGLTGTGKTHAIKRFMAKFCNSNKLIIRNQHEIINRYSVYINCNELFYASVSSLFNEILAQVRTVLNVKQVDAEEIDMSITYEDEEENTARNRETEEEDEEMADIKMNDCAAFLGQLRRMFQIKAGHGAVSRTNLYLVFDNAESLKYFNEASNLLLTLTKLNEYVNMGGAAIGVSVCSLFISEIDWHSLISECDLMSKTEAPRPFNVYFNEYSKDQMYTILKRTAIDLLTIQDNSMRSLTEGAEHQQSKQPSTGGSGMFNVEFYIKVI